MRKLIGLSIFIGLAVILYAQSTTLLLPIWNTTSRRYEWLKLGSGFKISGGVISVDVPAPSHIWVRVYDRKLTQAVDGTYTLPAGIQSIVIHANGLRLNSVVDYQVLTDATATRIAPRYPWPAIDWDVFADYDVDAP